MRALASRKRVLDDDDVGAIYDENPPKKSFRSLTQGMRVRNASLAMIKPKEGATARFKDKLKLLPARSPTRDLTKLPPAGGPTVHTSVATVGQGPQSIPPQVESVGRQVLGSRRPGASQKVDGTSRSSNVILARKPQASPQLRRGTNTTSVIRPFTGIVADTAPRTLGASPQQSSGTKNSSVIKPFTGIVADKAPRPLGCSPQQSRGKMTSSVTRPFTRIVADTVPQVPKPVLSTGSRLKLKKHNASEDIAAATPNVDIRLRALNCSETTIVKEATIKVPQDKIVAEVKEANIVLRGEDIVRLRGRRWLNDEVVNSFIALINMRNKKYFAGQGDTSIIPSVREKLCAGETLGTAESDCDVIEVPSPKASHHHSEKENVAPCNEVGSRRSSRPRTYAFNTFFHTRLCQNGYDYNGVRKWPERAGIDIADLDLTLVPVNLNNYHWVLVAVDIRAQEFIYFDSLYGGDDLNVLEALGRWLFDEIRDKHGLKRAEDMQIPSWKRTVNPSYLPRQHDDGSCGLFTIYTADYLELGKIPDYSQDDMAVLRQRAILFLTRGSLPDS